MRASPTGRGRSATTSSSSVGQGDLQANPLQMAVAYAAVGNGGTIVTPHLAQQVEGADGRVLQEIEFSPQRRIPISPEHQQVILDGLNKAAMEPGGTSYGVFKDFPVPIAGKTGTAERPPHGDQSWYIALAPYPDPQYVVAVTIEDGGFGADARRAGRAPDPGLAAGARRGQEGDPEGRARRRCGWRNHRVTHVRAPHPPAPVCRVQG